MLNSKETDKDEEIEKELPNIKHFLIFDCGFSKFTFDVITNLTKLVARNLFLGELVMTEEYKYLARNESKGDTLRVKLTYYIKNNYDDVRNEIMNKYGYKMEKDFEGVKTFVEHITTVYSMTIF